MITIARLFLALLILLPISALGAEEEPPGEPLKWLAVFEQSYGTEGLYPFELYPSDDSGASRLNLQDLNLAAARLLAESPAVVPSVAGLRARKMLPELRPVPPEEEYTWDPDLRLFTSSLGGERDLFHGARLLVEGAEAIRNRALRPDITTRKRWQRIYTDPAAPDFLRREIAAREFLMQYHETDLARTAMKIQESLQLLDEAIKLYALANSLSLGEVVTLEELQESRLIGFIERLPPGAELSITRIGEPPTANFQGVVLTPDPNSVTELQRQDAEKVWLKYGEYPPALALRARFEKPKEAVGLLDRAVAQWPDVPGLRVERMAQYARMRDASRWTEDMDYLLKNFPAAPILIELQVTAELSGMTQEPESRARFARMLADSRPDLLGHQLFAFQLSLDANDTVSAARILQRLTTTNAIWRHVLPDVPTAPESEKK